MRIRWKHFRTEGASFLKGLEILKLFLVLQKGIVGCQKAWSNLPVWTQQWSILTMLLLLLLHITFFLKSKSQGLHVSHGQLQQQQQQLCRRYSLIFSFFPLHTTALLYCNLFVAVKAALCQLLQYPLPVVCSQPVFFGCLNFLGFSIYPSK
jgi:hypothetical protein